MLLNWWCYTAGMQQERANWFQIEKKKKKRRHTQTHIKEAANEAAPRKAIQSKEIIIWPLQGP